MMTLPVLQLMSRQGCCLCDDAEAVISDFVRQGHCTLDVVDVDQDPALAMRFGMDVPVVLMGEKVCLMHRMTHAEIEILLEVAC